MRSSFAHEVCVDENVVQSRVIFLPLDDGDRRVLGQWVESSYTALTRGVWLKSRDCYEGLWDYGLLLQFLNRATANSSRRLTPHSAAVGLGTVISALSSPENRSAEEIKKILSFFGQSQEMTQESIDSAPSCPEFIWQLIEEWGADKGEEGFQLSSWLKQRTDSSLANDWWSKGDEHGEFPRPRVVFLLIRHPFSQCFALFALPCCLPSIVISVL